MKPKKLSISSSISNDLREELKKFIGHPIQRFMIGGNFGIYGTLNDSKYTGNQFNICFDINGILHTISMFSIQISREDFEEYDMVRLKINQFGKISTNHFGPEKEMLLRNRGIFYLQAVDEMIIQSIDVYGVLAKDFLDIDEDFPEEAQSVSADIDLLLKFNTHKDSFFTLYAKEGEIILNFYNERKAFDDFIANTKCSGKLSELKKKFSIR